MALDLDLDIGVDLDVTDEPEPSTPPTATDTGFLIHSLAAPETSPAGVQLVRSPGDARSLYDGEVALLAAIDGWFYTGGGRLYVSPLGVDEAAAAAAIPDKYGPGQLMAPEVVAAADIVALRDYGWDANRFYVAQAPDGATDAALITLKDALVDDAGGRFAELEADTIIIPGEAPGATREVPASVIKAALMSRNDLVTGNPNLAAAGNHTPGAAGQVDYALGIKEDRSLAQIRTLARDQINAFRVVNSRVRSYGYWTLADLAVLPQWWDVGGSRTIMALRAEEQAVAEEMLFGQVAADGVFLDKYQGALSGQLARYQRMGAIFGTEAKPGYTVDVSRVQNPVGQLAQGLVKAVLTVQTSPFAAALKLTLTRRAIATRTA
jgi:uncharacterized protein YwbE